MSGLCNILMVEDNPDDYEATLRSFRKNHLANPVNWCRSGQDALDFLTDKSVAADNPEKRLPGIIFLDLNMPGIDGRKVLTTLKGDAATRHIPVVILTTSADPKDVEHCYAAGASTYVQKPVTFEGLVDAVRTMKDYWLNIAILPHCS